MPEDFDVLSRITDLCRERNYSYYELAKRAGIPYSTLNTLYLKGTNPSLPTLHRICEGLGITLAQFFEEDNALHPTAEHQHLINRWDQLSIREKQLVSDMIDVILEQRK